MASHQQNTFMLSILMSLLISYPTLSFKIIDCGNSKTTKINVAQNNKNVVEYNDPSSMISINGKDTVELWCETDCWFSKCILTHQPNNADGCESSEEPYESEKREVFSEFENSKRHICKFEIEKDFSCQDIGDWKMTIVEDGFAKRTRESTFVFEPINEPPVESRSKGKQPGKLAGLLLRNKYTDCTIKNLRLWSGFPSFDKDSFKPSEDSWSLLPDSYSWRPINKATDQVYNATFINNFKENKFKVYSRTIDDCHNPNCKSVSDYYGSDTTCSMFVWFGAYDVKWSTCVMESDEYKERKLGYKINTKPKEYPYLGIKECLEYDIDDDWCQDCNDESEIHQLNENEIEVSRNTDSTYNLTSMECMDSPVEVVDLVYGNKPQNDLKSESFCYTPQSYLNHRQCNNNVSDVTWCNPKSKENDIRCSQSNLETNLFKGSCDEFSYARIKFACQDSYLDQNQYIAIGGAAGGFLLLLAIATSIIICRKRTTKNNNIASDNIELSLPRNENTSTATTKNFQPIPIRDFFKGTVSLERQQEFAKLNDNDAKRANVPSIHATMKKNQRKNQDKDIVAYDGNRVKVNVSPSDTDYINASWIREPVTERIYDCANLNPYLPVSQMTIIVTQNPTKETMNSYLTMLHQNSVDFVIHFSRSDASTTNFGNSTGISKKVVSRKSLNDFLSVEIWEVSKTKGGLRGARFSHGLEFLCFSGWELEGNISEETIRQLLTAVTLVRKEIGTNKDSVNLVLHDNDSGSSGAAVFLALQELLETIDNSLTAPKLQVDSIKGQVNIFEVVSNLRKKRAKMIVNYEQYQLLFKALVFYSKHKKEFDSIFKDKRGTRTSSEPHREDEDPYADSYLLYDYTGVDLFREDSVTYVEEDLVG